MTGTEHETSLVTLRHAGEGTAIVTINRPERRNALNFKIKELIADAVLKLGNDKSVCVIILTGTGKYFVAGTDIAEMATMTPTEHGLLRTDRVFTVLRECPKILIAAIEGYALGGGCELALACDMIIAGAGARLASPRSGSASCQERVRRSGWSGPSGATAP